MSYQNEPYSLRDTIEAVILQKNDQSAEFATIRLKRYPSHPFRITFSTITPFRTSDGREIAPLTLITHQYEGTDYAYDDPKIKTILDSVQTEIPLKHLCILEMDARHCFKCDAYRATQSFTRTDYKKEQVAILSDICEPCYQGVINRIKEYNKIARKHGGLTSLLVSQWLIKLKESSGHCTYCKKNVGFSELIIEHMVPLSKGGHNTIENITPSCRICNSSKGHLTLEEWKNRQTCGNLLYELQKRLKLSRFEITQLAIKRLAIHEGLVVDETGMEE